MIIGVYGSLKEGHYNHIDQWFKNAKKLSTIRLKGYDIYDLGFYPVIVPNREDKIGVVVEIWDISNSAYFQIRAMELGAGYREITELQDGYKFKIWIYDHIPKFSRLIPTGDWDGSLNNFDLDIDYDFDINDYDTYDELEEELLELLIADPELIFDPEIEHYINLNPKFKRKVEALDFNDEFDDTWIDDLDNDFLSKINNEKEYDFKMCDCLKKGIQPSWEYDSQLQAWRCSKCGTLQEDE
jgi:gamma-glutamylcyclotransferase (GGCT)/AIG2-like uncharacterized protein YtfP